MPVLHPDVSGLSPSLLCSTKTAISPFPQASLLTIAYRYLADSLFFILIMDSEMKEEAVLHKAGSFTFTEGTPLAVSYKETDGSL